MTSSGAAPSVSLGRWLVFALIVASWPIMVLLMWRALWTVPDAAVLQSPRMVPPPTLASFWLQTAMAAAEVAALAVLIWPRWRRWGLRVGLAALALPAWFLATVPNGLTTVDQVHRRGLVALVVVVWVAAIVTPIARRLSPRVS